MDRLNFLIDWYHKENERQTALNNSLNIPIGILTAIFALIFFLVKEFNFGSTTNTIVIPFLVFLGLAVISWIIAIFYLFRSYNNFFRGYEYDGLPFATQLNEYHEQLLTYYEKNKDQLGKDVDADSLYEDNLREMLSEYINTNIDNNDRKTEYLHKAKQFLFGSIISIIICSIPFMIDFVNHKDEIPSIKIVNFDQLNRISRDQDSSNLKIRKE